MTGMGRAILRPNERRTAADRALVADHVAAAPVIDSAMRDQLVQVARHVRPGGRRLMASFIFSGAFAGIGRTMVERSSSITVVTDS